MNPEGQAFLVKKHVGQHPQDEVLAVRLLHLAPVQRDSGQVNALDLRFPIGLQPIGRPPKTVDVAGRDSPRPSGPRYRNASTIRARTSGTGSSMVTPPGATCRITFATSSTKGRGTCAVISNHRPVASLTR